MAPKQINEVEAKSWGKDHDIAVYNWMLENDVEDDAGKLPTGKHLLTDTPALKSWSSSTLNSKMKTIRRRMKEKKDWHPLNDKLPMRLGLESTVKKLNAEEESDNPLYGPEYMPISSIHQSGGSSTPKPFKPSTSQPQSAAKRAKLVSPSKPTLSPASNYTKDGVRASQVESTLRLHEIMRRSPAPVHDQAQLSGSESKIPCSLKYQRKHISDAFNHFQKYWDPTGMKLVPMPFLLKYLRPLNLTSILIRPDTATAYLSALPDIRIYQYAKGNPTLTGYANAAYHVYPTAPWHLWRQPDSERLTLVNLHRASGILSASHSRHLSQHPHHRTVHPRRAYSSSQLSDVRCRFV
ncbi:hypothetical protein BJ741DRAFT_704887 [Chytriomyces cf. hyalinus JEL632]|nr:hypothetical protein BJ741DRAFT_704887 [Chytriomyces cf. hyalinus JEL632]